MPSKRILIADDDPRILDEVSEALRKEGYEVTAFHTGEDVISKCGMSCPDLVLLDILLGDIDGYTVAAKLRQTKSLEVVPIIFFTAQELDHPAIAKRLAGIGSCSFFSKMRPLEELLAKVKEKLT